MVVVVVPVGVSLLGKRASFRKKKAALNTPNNYLNGHRKQISIARTPGCVFHGGFYWRG